MSGGIGTQAEMGFGAAPQCFSGVEGGFDGGDYGWVVGGNFGGEAGYYVAVAIDEELFEVPEDAGLRVGGGSVVLAREEAVEALAEGFAGGADGLGLGGDEGFVEIVGVGAGDGILENMGKSTLKVPWQNLRISWLVPGSWAPKSLAGKPQTTRPESLKRA